MVTLPTSGVALIVIDMQRDFCAEGGYAHRLASPPHVVSMRSGLRIATAKLAPNGTK